MSTDERVDWFLKRTTGRGALLRTAVSTGLATWKDSPKEWNRDADGIAQQFASRQARRTINYSVQLGIGLLLKDDPRYYRAPEKGVGGRLKNAFISAFTVRDATGGRAPAYGRFAGIAASNAITKTWMPPSRNSWADVAACTGGQIGTQIGFNLFKEFWPDIKRAFK
jgi:hypothetical protein